MNILKEVLKSQVYPAIGCTEPVSVALTGAHASKLLGEPVREALFILDPGTYKNGMGVTLPNTKGEKGNLLAAAIGLLAAKPELGMQIFQAATPALVLKAKRLLKAKTAQMSILPGHQGIHVEARLKGKNHTAVCVISENHTDLTYVEKDGKKLMGSLRSNTRGALPFKTALRKASIMDMLQMAQRMDEADKAYIRKGVEMNLAAARQGMKLRKVGFYLQDLLKKGYLQDDIFSNTKILTACATDLRMDGQAVPIMSSGESGNQGILAILVPFSVGKAFRVNDDIIYKSIAFSHILNAYVKLFTGGLAPICGCAIAAGVGAAAAIVYQRNGKDIPGITLAVNNVISDLGGMLCDGAKSGCALKVVSSTDCAIRSAYMGMNHYGITQREGFIGHSAEETIQNLGRISTIGMAQVDPTIVDIMLAKQKR